MQCSQHNSLAVQVEMKALFPPFARLKRTQPVWTAAFVNVFSTVTSVWQGRDQATRLHVNENEAFFKYKSPRKPHLGRWSLMEPPPPCLHLHMLMLRAVGGSSGWRRSAEKPLRLNGPEENRCCDHFWGICKPAYKNQPQTFNVISARV